MRNAWLLIALSIVAFVGCKPAGPQTQSPDQRAWVDAIRRNRVPADCPPTFVEAVRRVQQRQGKILFDKEGSLLGFDLAGERVAIDDHDVIAVTALPGLRILLLAGESISSHSIEPICRQTALAELMFQDAKIVDADLARLAALPNLEIMALRRCAALTDEGLAALAKCPKLVQLRLPDNTFTDRAVEVLLPLKSLRLLDLRGCDQIDAAGLARLAYFEQLTTLRLGGQQVSDEVVKGLAGLPKLRSVTLDEAAITDSGLSALCPLKLEEINLSRCLGITDAGMAALGRCTTLKNIALRDLAISDAGLAPLASCPQLASLGLRELLVGDAALGSLEKLVSLRRLELSQTSFTPEGIQHLQQALPHCQIVVEETGQP